tara:strand:- start:1386 stop:1868 length:483 start_codon:yes stop_codon:yes gene_type:complete
LKKIKKLFSSTAGIKFLDKSLLNLSKYKNISTAVFYKNLKYTRSKYHFLSPGTYSAKNTYAFYPSYSTNMITKRSYFYKSNGRFFREEQNYYEHHRRQNIFYILDKKINNNDFDFKLLEKDVNFPVLIVIGDSLFKEKAKVYILNKNKILKNNLNCYRNI